jgi:uncharacterized membrane protein YuzA (DUF378 family)
MLQNLLISWSIVGIMTMFVVAILIGEPLKSIPIALLIVLLCGPIAWIVFTIMIIFSIKKEIKNRNGL